MNKQELIDKAVKECKGVWPLDDELSMWFEGDKFFTTKLLPIGVSSSSEYVCEKSQFRQRAKELGYGANGELTVKESLTDDWYCYESQKAIKLPPAGAECEYFGMTGNKWISAFIVGHDFFKNDIALFREEKYRGSIFYGTAYSFRPLDWNRKAEQERKKVVDAVMKYWRILDTGTLETFERLYDAGFLKLPEHKDEK